MRALGKWLIAPSLISASIVCSALAIEIAIRFLFPQFDTSGHVQFSQSIGPVAIGAPGTTQRQIKNTGDFDVMVTFNEAGFRDRHLPKEAGPGTIMAVGDSFTFGWGVEESVRFSNQLEKIIGHPVINIAAPTDFIGYRRLISYAIEKGATTSQIVVGVCMENDLSLYSNANLSSESKNFSSIKEWLIAHSATYFLFTTAVHNNKWLKSLAVRTGLIKENLSAIERPHYSPELVAASINNILALIEGFEARILIIPSRALWTGSIEQRMDTAQLHDAFLRELLKRNVHVIDLRPFMEKSGDPLSFHFNNDGHWNAKGHRLAAELLGASFH